MTKTNDQIPEKFAWPFLSGQVLYLVVLPAVRAKIFWDGGQKYSDVCDILLDDLAKNCESKIFHLTTIFFLATCTQY